MSWECSWFSFSQRPPAWTATKICRGPCLNRVLGCDLEVLVKHEKALMRRTVPPRLHPRDHHRIRVPLGVS
eukprot:scaffold1913_cov257-Pinguiococcus_pyrenoidosus.AAC.19